MSKMSDADFESIVAVLPPKRFLPDDQLKVRCEQIFDRYVLSLVLKGLTPPFEEVKNFTRKVSRHAFALRELLNPESAQMIKILFSVETIPDHLGRVQQGQVVKLLPGLVKQLDWCIQLCERPVATSRVPALWKYIEGRKGVPPASAKRRLVKELYDLFEETTQQVPSRRVDGSFMSFARIVGCLSCKFQMTDEMIDHSLREILRNRKAALRTPVVKVSDSTKSRSPAARKKKPQISFCDLANCWFSFGMALWPKERRSARHDNEHPFDTRCGTLSNIWSQPE